MITYPVDTKKRYSVYSILTGGVIKKDIIWPRADGGRIIGADPDLVMLLNVDEPPEYNSETHNLTITGWTADLVAQTYTCNYVLEPKQLLRVTARTTARTTLHVFWDSLPATFADLISLSLRRQIDCSTMVMMKRLPRSSNTRQPVSITIRCRSISLMRQNQFSSTGSNP
jgi:hypothetical protein